MDSVLPSGVDPPNAVKTIPRKPVKVTMGPNVKIQPVNEREVSVFYSFDNFNAN